MIKRIVEISSPSYLFIKQGQLCIRQNKEVVGRIPLEDLGVLLLAHPAISLSQAVLYLAVDNNTVIVLCDQKYQPVSLMLPLVGHSLHARILGFIHPVTGQYIETDAPLPVYFQHLLDTLR